MLMPTLGSQRNLFAMMEKSLLTNGRN